VIAVIQCAASKRPGAGRMQTQGGKPVLFVAQPEIAPRADDLHYARPDDDAGGGQTWRESLLRYNEKLGQNPLRLLPTRDLYERDIYRHLAKRVGDANLYILSAGWGLIPSTFLTPSYDITFSPGADAYKRRLKRDIYRDFCMLPADGGDEVLFFGGKDYLPLFCSLTGRLGVRRTVFYNSNTAPSAPGCLLRRFRTTTRTNWHYECVSRFIDGSL
jgi:hypothetical protein